MSGNRPEDGFFESGNGEMNLVRRACILRIERESGDTDIEARIIRFPNIPN
jgi:hypothetical protein